MLFRRIVGIAVCAILLLELSMYLGSSVVPGVEPARATSETISLVGNYPYWNTSNPTITVTKGDSVTINLSSGDMAAHRLLIDLDKDGEADQADCGTTDICSAQFPPSTTIPPFNIASNAGSYAYYCTIHYPYMTGSFDIQNPNPDFAVSANPSSLTILQGSNSNSTVTVSSINNFGGTINLSASVSPSGPITNFGTNPLIVSPGGTATSKLTISTPQTTALGGYSVTITGTNSSGSPSHNTAISVTVTQPDFSITSIPSSLTVAPNSSGMTFITMTSANGFSGTLTLSATVSPSGPQLSLNPSSITLTSGSSASSNLTVSTATSGLSSTPVAQGIYVVNVTASSGSLSHLTTVSLTVGSTSSPPTGNSNLPLLPVIGGIIGAIVIAGVAVFLIRRKQ